MKALVRRGADFAGIVGDKTGTKLNGVDVCIGDTVRVGKGKNHNECTGVVAVFTDNIGVMGLGSDPISDLDIIEIMESYKDLDVGSTLHRGYYEVRKFRN